MGMTADFFCPACGLRGHVSGGPDAGMLAETTTIYCQTCQTLQDAVTCPDIHARPARTLEPRCEKRKSHSVRLWSREQPCPRCDRAALQVDEAGDFVTWD